MICNRICTIKLTEKEVNTLNAAAIILYDLLIGAGDNAIEINNSEWDSESVETCYALLDDLCKQGEKVMEVK